MLKYPPTAKDQQRLLNYDIYEKIFLGDHFDAFGITSPQVKENISNDYARLRYVLVNMGGMISKLSADMLFEEFPTIRMADSDFLEALMHENKLRIQFYESALETSYRGDAVFRIRSDEKKNVIIEDLNPAIYFPVYDETNVRKEPKEHVLAWKVQLAGVLDSKGAQAFAVFIERHQKGKVISELWQLEGGELAINLDVKAYFPNILPEVNTGVDRFLVFHNKNYGINSLYFGISDYKDLTSLMFAINNRLTKIDNILDKHGDPILAVPKGVLDKDGKVNKNKFGLIEMDTTRSNGQVPQYIVWDARLESAFKEIEDLVEFLFLTSETSKSALGIDKDGMAESGRALKYKLLRTIAKKHRKEMYYDMTIKDILYTAQLFAKANGLSAGGVKLTKTPELPQIVWQDGIINDASETVDNEIKKVDAGLQSEVEAIATIDGITPAEAEEKHKVIQEEKKAKMPVFSVNPFNANDPANKNMNGKDGGNGNQ